MAKIIIKKSSVTSKVPVTGDLDYGELALNYADGKLFYKRSDNTIQELTGGGGGLSPWATKTANYTAVDGDRLIATTTSASFTITLPSSPSTGAFIQITDGDDWNVNNLTIARNGSTIEGVSDDLTVDIGGVTLDLIYTGSTWQVTATTGKEGPGTGATLTDKTLVNATITNYTESVVAIGTVTTSHTFNLTNGTVQTATLTASTACTFTMPTATAGKSFTVLLKQAATTGNGTATFTGVKWPTAGAPTITATAAKMDILTFVSDGTNWYGAITQGYTP